ncbi:6,7-dimethyl-8-ribityllumazine synthase [Isosphaera pallida ATCC 43644]|uniref:6,7-dimethyl-8-ribityllumazine synthase n=1 Tax=Isosphaera pallida (strain ATCC 43644 / DSM 9630 / IS1B) TaxID=575540 RepID=E8QXK6_ISOPI|nr:6,7-dimethyl-8-ribityllumazine synthase [Isosphaera pallida]ADV63054.1 6,7-dimethyl-8-ribityllumazine synthase [Isosphaera pallida ATCC 43644]
MSSSSSSSSRATGPTRYEGVALAPIEGRFAIVAARYNELVVDALVKGCLETFERFGVSADRLDLVRVPGSFELPVTALRLAEARRHRAIVCLGCVIRGETGHYDHVAGQAASGLMSVSVQTGLPIIFGVLTTDTVEQALNRAGLKAGNKGSEAAMTALEMVNLFERLDQAGKANFGFTTA